MFKKGYRIYVIEDEKDIAELIRYNLMLEGYHVEVYSSGEEGYAAIQSCEPDLLILDLMLPGMSGTDICRRIKENPSFSQIPIIMVTAKSEDHDVVQGLDVGADDYLGKPFSPKVLTARVKAILRRFRGLKEQNENPVLKVKEIVVHPGKHEVMIADRKVQLTNSEFQILYFLASRPGWVYTRAQIVDALHGESYAVTDRSVDFQIVGLRKKLGDAGSYIETVRGVGYRFQELI